MSRVDFDLTYVGSDADNHHLDFYDAAAALLGFQRSLAITTHFILNDEVITQAPALRGARILSSPPEEGSWKATAIVIAGMFSLGTAQPDTPVGHLISSAYDYVISRTLGFHVDYDSTLGRQLEDAHRAGTINRPAPTASRFDSVIEKCETGIRDMHRPIVFSETASSAHIVTRSHDFTRPIGPDLDLGTFEQIRMRIEGGAVVLVGRISSYNVNTFKGRIFIGEQERSIPFQLDEVARTPGRIAAITVSLDANGRSRSAEHGEVTVTAVPIESRTGRLTRLIVTDIQLSGSARTGPTVRTV